MDKKNYSLIATGGTFDRFHKGHAALLHKAFEVGEKVIIGVTSAKMVKKENKILGDYVLPYDERVKDVMSFLKENGYLEREIISQLNNTYGPTVLENGLGAIICTRETRKGAVLINKARKQKRLPVCDIVECSFISSVDGYHISSTRIRLGEINREGEILLKIKAGLKLPEFLRNSLAKPIDMLFPNTNQVVKNIGNAVMVITVGDVVFAELQSAGFEADIAVLDLKVEREYVGNRLNIDFDFKVINKAGVVSKRLTDVLKKAVRDKLKLDKKTYIEIDGEEDLAVIPAILVAPLGTIILYGQPNYMGIENGVVRVLVTEKKKKWVVELLRQFK